VAEAPRDANETPDAVLERFHRKPRAMRIAEARLRLIASIAFGATVGLLLPDAWRWVTRFLVGWDAGVALYMVFALVAIATTDREHIRHKALMQDDGRFVILVLVAVAGFVSLGAIIAMIGAQSRTGTELALAVATILLSWAMIHTTFALHYAHDYYRGAKPGGLDFPGGEMPDYWDFIYFSFVIGMTAQTSDVNIADRMIRRTATAHGFASFIYNTTVLALMVSIVAEAL
jgi:uncharacterized membrane protein